MRRSAEVFADTSGWAAYVLSTEPAHDRAKALIQGFHRNKTRILTINYVLAELAALLIRLRAAHAMRIRILETIHSAAWVEVVHIDLATDREALELLKSRADKDWTLVDCTSFVIMERRETREALTTDHHFEQAGFVALLKQSG